MSKMQALRCMMQMMEHVLALPHIFKEQENWPPEAATLASERIMLIQKIFPPVLDLST